MAVYALHLQLEQYGPTSAFWALCQGDVTKNGIWPSTCGQTGASTIAILKPTLKPIHLVLSVCSCNTVLLQLFYPFNLYFEPSDLRFVNRRCQREVTVVVWEPEEGIRGHSRWYGCPQHSLLSPVSLFSLFSLHLSVCSIVLSLLLSLPSQWWPGYVQSSISLNLAKQQTPFKVCPTKWWWRWWRPDRLLQCRRAELL